jgi:choline dehydrogenase
MEMGVPFVEDFNDPQQPVCSITKLRTTVTAEGKRCSTNEAFLPKKEVKNRKNLKICLGVVVQRLDIGGNRAKGVFVEMEHQAGTTFYTKAREIILCGGAVASPQILLLRYLY